MSKKPLDQEDGEHFLWEAYHRTRGDDIEVKRADLQLARPDMELPEKKGRTNIIEISRDQLWGLLTGTKREKKWFNSD